MIREYNGKEPEIADSAYVDEDAVVIGEVKIGKDSSIWPGAVIRGDGGPIEIGERTSIQDNAVVHVNVGSYLDIGDECTIGHGAMVHGQEVGDRVLIAINSTVLQGVKIGKESIIAANSLVREGMEIPERAFFAGSPGEVKKQLDDEQVERIELASEHYSELGKEYMPK